MSFDPIVHLRGTAEGNSASGNFTVSSPVPLAKWDIIISVGNSSPTDTANWNQVGFQTLWYRLYNVFTPPDTSWQFSQGHVWVMVFRPRLFTAAEAAAWYADGAVNIGQFGVAFQADKLFTHPGVDDTRVWDEDRAFTQPYTIAHGFGSKENDGHDSATGEQVFTYSNPDGGGGATQTIGSHHAHVTGPDSEFGTDQLLALSSPYTFDDVGTFGTRSSTATVTVNNNPGDVPFVAARTFVYYIFWDVGVEPPPVYPPDPLPLGGGQLTPRGRKSQYQNMPYEVTEAMLRRR